MSKVCVVSLGCAKNLTDSEVMLSSLKKSGYEITDKEMQAEIIIVNTCCFIDSAKQESIDTILDIADLKKDAKLKLLIVAGCLGERYKEDVLKELPEVDGVCGTGDFANISEIIDKVKKERGLYISGHSNAPLDITDRILATPSYTAYLKIAEGCDNCCTYCIIPQIRGRYRSRPMENIILEAKSLAEKGVKELIVIAQDTSCYGKDLYNEAKLDQLLSELSKIEGIEWIRVHYLYPEEITDSLLNEFAKNDKVVNYFDIPIQHISNDVLRRMARKTNSDKIKILINKIRGLMPDAVIRTSLIVGFPGETEENFYELVDFLKQYKIDRVGAFAYSQEEDTPAATFENQIDDQEKIDRQQKIMEIQHEIVENMNTSKVGNTYEVLVEGFDKVLKMNFGRTFGDSVDVDPKVFFTAKNKPSPGDFVKVKINDYIDYDLLGEMID